jgi:hypothetical protein
MFDFINYIMEIMSKSPSLPLVKLQGKLKLNEKKSTLSISFYDGLQYSNALVISFFQWLTLAEPSIA